MSDSAPFIASTEDISGGCCTLYADPFRIWMLYRGRPGQGGCQLTLGLDVAQRAQAVAQLLAEGLVEIRHEQGWLRLRKLAADRYSVCLAISPTGRAGLMVLLDRAQLDQLS